ncbi:MAG: hypothetical protein ACNA8R_07225 [Nitriliruptoraceae bacterium]
MDSTLVITLVVVAVLGLGVVLVLRTLDRFQDRRQAEKLPPEDRHLDDETVSDVLDDPLDRDE